MKNYWLDKKNEQSKKYTIYYSYASDSNIDRISLSEEEFLADNSTFVESPKGGIRLLTRSGHTFEMNDDLYLYRDAAGVLTQENSSI